MNLNEIYQASLLADATYANDLNNLTSKEELARQLTDERGGSGMTLAQAQYISDNFRVIEQQENTDSGFSATLFQHIQSGEYYLSMRGSEIPNTIDNIIDDWFSADIVGIGVKGVAVAQTVDMINFYSM